MKETWLYRPQPALRLMVERSPHKRSRVSSSLSLTTLTGNSLMTASVSISSSAQNQSESDLLKSSGWNPLFSTSGTATLICLGSVQLALQPSVDVTLFGKVEKFNVLSLVSESTVSEKDTESI